MSREWHRFGEERERYVYGVAWVRRSLKGDV